MFCLFAPKMRFRPQRMRTKCVLRQRRAGKRKAVTVMPRSRRSCAVVHIRTRGRQRAEPLFESGHYRLGPCGDCHCQPEQEQLGLNRVSRAAVPPSARGLANSVTNLSKFPRANTRAPRARATCSAPSDPSASHPDERSRALLRDSGRFRGCASKRRRCRQWPPTRSQRTKRGCSRPLSHRERSCSVIAS
jgi:hypothetical protein